jgi:hypothetical protein
MTESLGWQGHDAGIPRDRMVLLDLGWEMPGMSWGPVGKVSGLV